MTNDPSDSHQGNQPAGLGCNEELGAWRPIETAPRDSNARLVWVPENRCIYCVSWTDGNCEPGEEGDPPGWVIFGGGYRAYLRDGRATHWMPLPAAPDSTAGDEVQRLRQAWEDTRMQRDELLAHIAGKGPLPQWAAKWLSA